MRLAYCAFALLVLHAPVLTAQPASSELTPGRRLRITTGDTHARQLIGILERIDADSVVIHADPPPGLDPTREAFALATVRSVEVNSRPAGAGFAFGAFIGALTGAMLVQASPDDGVGLKGPATVLMTIVGALGGGLIGVIVTPDRWQTVYPR